MGRAMTAAEAKMDMMRFWPLVAFLLLQAGGGLWWAATVNGQIGHLQESKIKIERVTEDIPEMKATLKNVERIVERMESRETGKRDRP